MIAMISSLIVGLFSSVYVLYAVVFLTIGYYFSTSTHDKWLKLEVPHIKPLPVFGNSMKMVLSKEHPIDFFSRIYNRFPEEKICGFYQMNTPFLMIRDPEPSINIMANSLFMLNGDRWRTMRQKLSPGFTSGKLKDTHDQINDCIDQLMEVIDEKLKISDHFELRELVDNFSTDVIGMSAFGLKLDMIKNGNEDFRKFGKKIFQSDLKQRFIQAMLLFCPKLVLTLKLKQFPEDAANFYASMFREVLEYRDRNNVVRNDVTQTLIQARKDLVANDDSGDSTCMYSITTMIFRRATKNYKVHSQLN